MDEREAARLLDGLAGLRLPDAGGVAPVWWLAGTALAAALAILAARRIHRARRAAAPARRLLAESRAELDALAARLGPAGSEPAPEAVREVLAGASVLARRLALAAAPRARVAALEGRAWLDALDALCAPASGAHGRAARTGDADTDRRPFADGPGRLLATAPYEPEPRCSRAELDGLLDALGALARGAAASAGTRAGAA